MVMTERNSTDAPDLDTAAAPAGPRQIAVVADDHAVVRRAVERILETKGIEVALAADNGNDVILEVRRKSPDLVIVDLAMPGGGLPLVEELHRLSPNLPIVVFSMQLERDWAIRCLAAGASGFISKSESLEELDSAIGKVLAGRRHVSPRVAELLIDRAVGADDGAAAPHTKLSGREFEVFERIVAGDSLAEIAATLGLSPKTVTTYRARVLQKLGMTRNAELVRYAIRHGFVEG